MVNGGGWKGIVYPCTLVVTPFIPGQPVRQRRQNPQAALPLLSQLPDLTQPLVCSTTTPSKRNCLPCSAFYDFQYTASPSDPVIPFFGLVTALTVGAGRWEQAYGR